MFFHIPENSSGRAASKFLKKQWFYFFPQVFRERSNFFQALTLSPQSEANKMHFFSILGTGWTIAGWSPAVKLSASSTSFRQSLS